MKEILFKISNSGYSKTLAVLLTVAASFAFCESALADINFYTQDAANISIKNKGYVYNNDLNSSGVGVKTLSGFRRSLVFNHVWTKIWHNNTQDYFSSVAFKYGLDGSIDKTYYLKDGTWSGNDQTWQTVNSEITIFNENGLTPGYHYLRFYFYAQTGNFPGERWLSNANMNYQIDFTVPGFIMKDIDFGTKKSQSSQEISFTSYGWASCTATINSNCNGAFSFEKNSATPTKTITVGNNKGTYTIWFDPEKIGAGETCKATITFSGTIGDPSGDTGTITKTINLKGTRYSGNIVVLIADSAKLQNGSVLLSGYMKETGCNTIAQYGFKYGTSSTMSSYTRVQVGTNNIPAGTVWTKTLTGLTAGIKYYYVAYAQNGDASKKDDSDIRSFIFPGECVYPEPINDTIYVTVNNSLAADIPCELQFKTLDNAISKIKESYFYDSGTKNLKYNIVMQIVPTDNPYSGNNKIEDINNSSTWTKALVLRSTEDKLQPILGKLNIVKSKNLVVDNIRIERTDGGDALDIQNGSTEWHALPVGDVADANVSIKNCYIASTGLTGIQVWGYDGITFENNDIECSLPTNKTGNELINIVCFGASMKIQQSKNIKFIRNNFRGSHTTSLWIQGLRGGLFMNNVFWNSNDSYHTNYLNNASFVRLVTQLKMTSEACYNKNENIGIYYNTFYLAEYSDNKNTRKVDFFRLGSEYTLKNSEGTSVDINVNWDLNNPNTIRFQYNNCYSYDKTYVTGANTTWYKGDTKSKWCGSFNFNNFWSEYDKAKGNTSSSFAIKACSDDSEVIKYINVSENVCSGAEDPAGLMVNGENLNLGSSVTNDVSGLGAENIASDRLHAGNIRPKSGATGAGASSSTGNDGTIVLNVNDNITSAQREIDVTEIGFTSGTITCSLSGTNADKFGLSHTTADVSATKVIIASFSKPSATGTYNATINFTGDLTMTIPVQGVYGNDTPVEGGWTLGAYQQTTGTKVDTIVWNGGASGEADVWDNRNNWYKLNGDRVTCADLLPENLVVIIPAKKATGKYPMPKSGEIDNYPVLPEFNEGRGEEPINAGYGMDDVTASKFTSVFDMEESSALKGVENLVSNGIRHYDEAKSSFTAERTEWILVGTVIRPFEDDKKVKARNIVSGDYFLDHEPNVYMRKIAIDGSECSWEEPFVSLDEEVKSTEAFSIIIPDDYGDYHLPSDIYYTYYAQNPAMLNDGLVAKTFTYGGWFVNESALPNFTGLTQGAQNILCNTYPANLKARAAAIANSGTIKAFDRTSKREYKGHQLVLNNFVTVADDDTEIKSQNGFIFTPTSGTTFTTNAELYSDNSTYYKSTEVSKPYFYLWLANLNGTGGSVASITYDALKTDEFNGVLDAERTVLSSQSAVPSLYIIRYNKALDMLTIPTLDEPIPLGVTVNSNMNLVFTSMRSNNFESAILEDRLAGVSYDLLKGESCEIALAKGTYEGRFYLNLSAEEQQDIPTGDKPAEGSKEISVYAQEDGTVVISAPLDENLKHAEITDMGGVTRTIELKDAHYNRIKIGGVQGAYVVKAIGEAQSKTAKVIVK
ncbi:MAG: hypothetical protein MJ007_06965 [Paludibacteraceae bacterium]|nr:hypothetical protein [Paludibacteraceae bacterium]